MTRLLDEAIQKASSLSESQQDAIAEMILQEISSENRWEKQFKASSNALEKLARKALDEDQSGKTKELNLERDFPQN